MDVIMHEASQREISENQEVKNNRNISNGRNGTNSSNSKIEPVDIEFRNVFFNASLGFRKGKICALFARKIFKLLLSPKRAH